MSRYIDGFLLCIKTSLLEDYRALAEKAAAIWKEHGALEVWESAGDDLEAKETASFTQTAQAAPDETVVFSWIAFESREHRDAVNAKVIADPRLSEMCDPSKMLFDCKRMSYGGFRTMVRL